jgi:hypothetical protein
MSTVTRKQFNSDFSKGGININDMAPETKAKLNKLGISDSDLTKIAGKDGRISGTEHNKLFTLLDKFDKNGSGNSFVDKDSAGAPTSSGEAYQTLKSELDRNVAKARSQGVIHLGMRDASTKEADALEKANPKSDGGVVRIEAFKKNGEVNYEGKNYDLKKEADLDAYRDALVNGTDKMPTKQAQDFVDFLKTQKEESRDELAQLGVTFFKTGEGKLPMNRLVISGHGWNGTISGDDDGEFKLSDVEKLAKVFPEGAKKIEHVAVSACFCAGDKSFSTLRAAFPNLKSAFAYNEFSPKAESGAPVHLRKWESLTEAKVDSSQVDPPFAKTATWNSVDGTQGLPKITLADAEKAVKDRESILNDYRSGKKKLTSNQSDAELNEYYARILDLLRHPDISKEREAEVEKLRQEVYDFRHPH